MIAGSMVGIALNTRGQDQQTSASGGPSIPAIHQFSLKQTLDYATKNSVKVKNALLDYQIQYESNRATTSAALPQVTGSIGFTYYFQSPVAVAPGSFFSAFDSSGNPKPEPKLVALPFAVPYNATAGVTLRQVLFDGQVFVGLQARQAALDYYTKAREVTEQSLRANIYKVYYQLLLSKSQVALIDANIARAEDLLHNSQAMFKNGFAEKLDVDKATVQLSNLQATRVQTLYSIDNGYLGLKMLMGMPIHDSLALTDTLTYDMVREGTLDDNYKYTDRKDYQLLEINRNLNLFDIERYKRQRIPTASLVLNYTQAGYGLDFSDIAKLSFFYPQSYVGLNISVPLFDGFYKDANIRKSSLTLQETENNLEALKISIDNDVKDAQLRFTAALASLDFEKQNMDLAATVYDQTRKKFEQGLGSNTEITSAQTDLIQAQNNYYTALYNAIAAKVDYQNATGKL